MIVLVQAPMACSHRPPGHAGSAAGLAVIFTVAAGLAVIFTVTPAAWGGHGVACWGVCVGGRERRGDFWVVISYAGCSNLIVKTVLVWHISWTVMCRAACSSCSELAAL